MIALIAISYIVYAQNKPNLLCRLPIYRRATMELLSYVFVFKLKITLMTNAAKQKINPNKSFGNFDSFLLFYFK